MTKSPPTQKKPTLRRLPSFGPPQPRARRRALPVADSYYLASVVAPMTSPPPAPLPPSSLCTPQNRPPPARGVAISLPSVVTRGVGSEALQGGAISVNSPFVSLYCTRTLKSVHDMGSSFAPNHIGMPLVSPKLKLDFLRRQVLMSRNISGGPPISMFMGGLNYQIEHHLFPSMARPQLRKAQPLVAAYCAAQGVPYTRTTLWQSYRIVIGYLNTVGLRGKDPFLCPLIAQRRALYPADSTSRSASPA